MTQKKGLSRRQFLAGVGVAGLSVASTGIAGCFSSDTGGSDSEPILTATPAVATSSAAYSMRFADFNNYEFVAERSVSPYTVEPGGANLVNLGQFTDDDPTTSEWQVAILSDEALERLVENCSVVSDTRSGWSEYFEIYQHNKVWYAPSFITIDATVHTFRLLFDRVLTDVESNYLIEAVDELSKNMVVASQDQYQQLKGTDFENAALRNIAFFSVGATLADSSFQVPAEVSDLVNQELTLITEANETTASPIINHGQDSGGDATRTESLDYTQFIPRNHYTNSETLMSYWRLTKWYGMATFRSSHEDEVRSALLLSNALLQGENERLWYAIFDTINFFVGECDDITFYQYLVETRDIYGEGGLADLSLVTDPDTFAQASALITEMPPPQINSIPTSESEAPAVHDKAITGLRFLGERFTIDAAIFQRLIADEVQDRYLPTALDIPAAMGSSEAASILESEGVMTTYPDYAGKLQEAQNYFLDTTGDAATSVTTDVWTSNLYWGWLYMLQPLIDNNNQEGLPSFMTTQAWTRKELNTFEGSWTELKHDTGAYSKPPQGYYGAGGPLNPIDDRGYVEPSPVLFGRLASLCQMTIDGLETRTMLSEETRTGLERLRHVAETCTVISEKELTGGTITDTEYEFIRNIGDELYDIWQVARQEELQNLDYVGGILDYLNFHPCGIITDVATDAHNGQTLEEATGLVKEIYVVFPRDGELVIGRGAVYTQYEFEVDVNARMTDEQWHERMRDWSTPLPKLAEWKTSYMADISNL